MNASFLRALHQNCLEPLESRIAPATIFVGNPNINDIEYADAPFINTETPADPIAAQVGPGVVGVNDTFILKLSQGDQVILFAPGGNTDFITVSDGNAVAFFVDHNRDGEVQAVELSGLSLGDGVSIAVKGAVNGDVVTNLKADGTLDLATPGGIGGLVSSKQNLAKFSGSDVLGGIFVGGSISSITGAFIGKITAGNGADGEKFDFFRGNPNDPAAVDVPGGNGTLAVAAVAGEAGPSINNVLVKGITDRIEAGDGGVGGEKGGSVSNIEVTSDSSGFLIAAGNGGGGSKGGAGGSVSSVYVSGFSDETPNNPGGPTNSDTSLAATRIVAGLGGNADAGSSGKGGPGGGLTKVFVGYERAGNGVEPSTNLSQDSILLSAGAGGDGKTAGKGGTIKSVQVRASVKDGLGDEIALIGGAGGDAFAGGKAAEGGALSKVDVRNQNPIVSGSIVTLRAGDGGAAPGEAKGATGGSITNADILGEGLVLIAGNGSAGSTGGKGGAIKSVETIISETVITRELTLNAGAGGNGSSGNGGEGGILSKVLVSTADFSVLNLNGGNSANGGTSTSAKGGPGGALTKVTILEIPLDTAVEGDAVIRGGTGGNGGTGGGVGGQLNKVVLSSFDLNINASAGAGGSATGGGNGGKGGEVKSAQLSSNGTDKDAPVTGTLSGGAGGNGSIGGKGGGVSKSAFSVDGDVSVIGGAGGNGVGGASGRGGALQKTGAFSTFGSGTLRGGDAGLTGGAAAAGGGISNGSVLRANMAITIQAGDGHNGGAGGSLEKVSFSSSAASLLPAPTGNILVSAGDGSGAGAGGSIKSLIGFISSGETSTSTFSAGLGGASAGGSITKLDILGGGAPGGVATILAGDAGSGAKGGDVREISLVGVTPGTILRSIAAGNGSTGGSVSQVYALGVDIGNRSGVEYGYATMGGIFAGVGSGGANGSVTDIRAEGIAAIVAGRGAVPDFAERVSRVIIGTSNAPVDLLKVEQGDFVADAGDPNFATVDLADYATDNLVGFYQDPTRPETNKFLFTDANGNAIYETGETPRDGLIMARVIDLPTFNFTPEAYMTTAGFFDYNNRLG